MVLTGCQSGPKQEGTAGSGGLVFTSNGDGTCYVSGMGTCTDAYVTVPSVSPAGDRVTGIGDGAFTGCMTLKGLVLPASIAAIGNTAFMGCENLTSVVCYGKPTIASTAFNGCPGVQISYTDDDSSVGAGNTGTEGNPTLSTLAGPTEPVEPTKPATPTEPEFVMPEKTSEGLEFQSNGNGTCSVIGLGTCTDLTVVVPSESPAGDRVTSIGEVAFHHGSWNSGNEHAPNIKEIILPDSVTSIGRSAFDCCKSLVSIRMPEGITSIGQCAFYGCSSLASIHIPNGITRIEASTFTFCSSLTEVTIPDGVRSIGEGAFQYCKGLTNVTIPNSVTNIDKDAFGNCEMLTTVTFNGTSAQWTAISKDKYWDYESNSLRVEYSDGGSSSGTTWTKCTHCNYGWVTCKRCGGSGKQYDPWTDGNILCGGCGGQTQVYCDYCGGSGQINE